MSIVRPLFLYGHSDMMGKINNWCVSGSFISLACSYYLLHLLRVVEVIVGSNQYASVILTILCFLLPVKYALIHFSVGSNGFFFLIAGLTAYYMRMFIVWLVSKRSFPRANLTVIPL